MLLLLLACTGEAPSNIDPFTGLASFTVSGGAAGTELVELELVGFSKIAGEADTVITAADDVGVYELMMVIEDLDGPGDYAPRLVRYRKGLQALVDAEASCAVTVTDTGDVTQPWSLAFSCEGLHTEEGLAEGGEAPWSFVDGELSGGATTTLAARDERFAASGYAFHLELVSGPLGGDLIDERDLDRALVVPWRGDETWVVFEDGADESLDDLSVKVEASAGRISLQRWSRALTSADSELQVSVTAAEGELTAALEGAEGETTGAYIVLTLWEDVTGGEDRQVVLIY